MLFGLLFVFWMILCGKITAETVIFGLVISGAVSAFCRKIGLWPAWADRAFFALGLLLPRYFAHLFVEILKSSVEVLRLVLSPHLTDLQPRLLFIRTELDNSAAIVARADSITLTPGTFTVNLQPGGVICVHAINAAAAQSARAMCKGPLLKQIDQILKDAKGRGGDVK